MAWQLLTSSLSASSNLSGDLAIFNYLVYEQSEIYSEPVELYLFNRADNEYWSYTSSDTIITYDGRDYNPILIRRSDIILDSNSLKTQIEITVALDNSFVRNSIKEPIEGVVRLTIYRKQGNNYVTYWKGFIRGISFKSNTSVIICNLKSDSLKRGGLMRKYSRQCDLPLFSELCTISKSDSDYYVTGTINTVDGVEINATIFSSKIDGWFVGGIFKLDNGNCTQKIVYHSGTTIKIARSISAVQAGLTFTAWAGCDHLKATCKDKFNNKLNYGGQPYLPNKNPFTGDAVV